MRFWDQATGQQDMPSTDESDGESDGKDAVSSKECRVLARAFVQQVIICMYVCVCVCVFVMPRNAHTCNRS